MDAHEDEIYQEWAKGEIERLRIRRDNLNTQIRGLEKSLLPQ